MSDGSTDYLYISLPCRTAVDFKCGWDGINNIIIWSIQAIHVASDEAEHFVMNLQQGSVTGMPVPWNIDPRTP